MQILFPRFFRKAQPYHALNPFLVIGIFIITTTSGAFGQADTCSKPKVAVQFTEFHDDALDLLNSKGVSQSKASWEHQIQGKVIEELGMASPGIDFIPDGGSGPPEDCDYILSYIITVIGAGGDIEVAGLLHSEYTAFYMQSTLAQNNKCGAVNWILDVEITKEYEDLFQTIEHNIDAHEDIGKRIQEIEKERRVPPRGPEMKTSQSRPYVSPLEGQRSLDIKIDVTNCRGEPVYKENSGQRVILPRRRERGEISPEKSFPQNCLITSNAVILIIVRPVGACATYTLQMGLKPGIERFKIQTCGLDKEVIHEEEIRIHGLDLTIRPQKKVICPGERTNVLIELSEVDPDGNKTPVAGRKVTLDVKGLVDGDVTPAAKEVFTNEMGQAKLTYRAGKRDSGVVFKAEFQPKGFAESVKDFAVIGLCGRGWSGTLTMKQKYTFSCEATRSSGRRTETLKEYDMRKQTATMILQIDEIKVGEVGIDAKQGSEIKMSGTIQEIISESMDLNSVYDDRWNHLRETLNGNTSCDGAGGHLSISFRKTGSGCRDELKSLMEEMRTTTDLKQREQLMEKLNALMSEKGKNGSTPLKIIVQYIPECVYALTFNRFKETQDPEKGHQIIADDTLNRDKTVTPVQFDFSGTLEQVPDESDQIFGTFNGVTDRQDFKKVWGCPQSILFQSITLELSRKRVQ